MRKTEIIDFRDFVRGNYGQRVTNRLGLVFGGYTALSLPSFVISPSSWLSPPPLILKGYLIVIGLGVVLIIAAMMESTFARNGNSELASTIVNFFKFALPMAFIAALIIFVLTNPLI